MKIQEMIDVMAKEGYAWECAHHFRRKGFYAQFYKEGEEPCECGSIASTPWETSGHGFTVREATEQAFSIARGEQVIEYQPEDFQ